MLITKEKQKTTFESLKDTLGISNVLEAPSLKKIVVSVGTGRKARNDKHANEFIMGRIATITGQKPSPRGAKKSVASFKIREGDTIGTMVTLRGDQMWNFLEKLIHVALPRTKDFRGIKRSAVDPMGNLTIGIKEHTIFPETSEEEIKNVFGMSITLVTTASNKDQAMKFFEHLEIPFERIKEDK